MVHPSTTLRRTRRLFWWVVRLLIWSSYIPSWSNASKPVRGWQRVYVLHGLVRRGQSYACPWFLCPQISIHTNLTPSCSRSLARQLGERPWPHETLSWSGFYVIVVRAFTLPIMVDSYLATCPVSTGAVVLKGKIHLPTCAALTDILFFISQRWWLALERL